MKYPTSNFAEMISYTLHAKRVEPVERNHDGVRQHIHRFEIKGGVPLTDLIAKSIVQSNSLLRRMRA